ncbi:hypothetical protein SDC9_184573 [bioreactor metagenome]|uniref:Uncharacterized protein n=1 Tax=bioreactor metagenome TaxID=1076179 RepID=A0A645HDF1_9ZZZZ
MFKGDLGKGDALYIIGADGVKGHVQMPGFLHHAVQVLRDRGRVHGIHLADHGFAARLADLLSGRFQFCKCSAGQVHHGAFSGKPQRNGPAYLAAATKHNCNFVL